MTDTIRSVLIWDWTVRLFHWCTVVLVAMMWWTAEQGVMDWHRRLGLLLSGLLVYRIIWGLLGPSTAKFTTMLAGPRALAAYVKDLVAGRHTAVHGHNPLGALSVIAMLLALAVQLGTGLFAIDVDGLESGPLATLVSFELGRQFAEIHETSFNILLGLIILHVSAILVYLLVFRDNLVKPMLTGRRAATDFGESAPADGKADWRRVAVSAVLAVLAVTLVQWIGG